MKDSQKKGNKSEPLLLDAAYEGDTERVKVLLKEGADINHQDRFKRSALMMAVSGGNLDAIKARSEQHGAERAG